MNRYDTLKARFDTGAVNLINEDLFSWNTGGNQKVGESEYHIRNLKKDMKKPVGLTMVSIDLMNGISKIELSSKRLEKRYPELIHKNNIEYLVHKINETGIIDIDSNRFIDSAEILRFDPCANLYGFGDTGKCVNAINVLSSSNLKYFARPYEKSGISFMAKAKTKKIQFRVYPKYPEMCKKKNGLIREFINPDHFDNCIRSEMQLTQFNEMRQVLGIQETRPVKLTDILESKEMILYNGFSNIIKWDFGKTENDLWDNDSMEFIADTLTNEEMAFSHKEKAVAEYFITKYFNRDIQKLNAYISNEIKGNISTYRKRYKKAIERVPTKQNIEQVSYFMNELKKAA